MEQRIEDGAFAGAGVAYSYHHLYTFQLIKNLHAPKNFLQRALQAV